VQHERDQPGGKVAREAGAARGAGWAARRTRRLRDKGPVDAKYPLSPVLVVPLATSSLWIPPLIGVACLVATFLDTTSFVFPLCLKIASLGQGVPEHRVQLHTILGKSGRAEQDANQNGGSRNSNCRASASRHCCASFKSESGLPPCWDDPQIAFVTPNEKVSLDRQRDPRTGNDTGWH
jgi:hypothetical protein